MDYRIKKVKKDEKKNFLKLILQYIQIVPLSENLNLNQSEIIYLPGIDKDKWVCLFPIFQVDYKS